MGNKLHGWGRGMGCLPALEALGVGSRIVGLRFPSPASSVISQLVRGKSRCYALPSGLKSMTPVAPGMVLFPSVLGPPLPAGPQKPPQFCPTVPWLGKAHRGDGRGLHGRGLHSPPTPTWHAPASSTCPRHWQIMLETVLVWLRQTKRQLACTQALL